MVVFSSRPCLLLSLDVIGVTWQNSFLVYARRRVVQTSEHQIGTWEGPEKPLWGLYDSLM